METQVLGLSVDSVPCLFAWAESLGGITYPLLSDFYPHGAIAQCYGVLRSEGYSERALFIVDKQGIIRYVDVHAIDEQPDNEVLFSALAEIEPALAGRANAAAAVAPATAPAPQPAPDVDVVLYCTSWCPECRRVRAWLKERNIPFAEFDLSRDRTAAQKVRGWTGGYETTPTITIRGEVIIGYDRAKVEKLLGSKS